MGFDAFIAAMKQELARLTEEAAKRRTTGLDLSMASLDRVQQLVERIIAKKADPIVGLTELLTRYIGETLRTCVGGKWAADGENVGIRAIPQLPPAYLFAPMDIVQHHQRWQWSSIREQTERYDLVLQRLRFAEWMAAHERELTDLQRELPGLDFTPSSLDRLEPLIVASWSGQVAERKRARDRLGRYVGEVYRRSRPGRDWTLCEDPRNVAFGKRCVGHIDPGLAIMRFADDPKPGGVRRLVEVWLAPARPIRGRTGVVSFSIYYSKPTLLTAAHARLKKQGLVVTRRGGGILAASEGEASIEIVQRKGSAVTREARELADQAGGADAAALLSARGRFEVVWDPDDTGDLVNALGIIQEALETLTGGITYDDDGVRPRLGRRSG